MPTLNLTDRAIRSLKPSQGRGEYFDRSLAGFGVRVAPTGRRTFVLRYRSKTGREHRISLGTYPALSLADARDRARQLIAAVARGEDPAAERQAVAAGTFAEVAESFLEHHAALRSPRTYDAYRRVLERDVIPRWGKWKAPDVHRAHVMELLDEIAHDRGAPIAANRTRAILHSLFNFALARDLVPSNPVAGVPRPAPESRRDRVLSPSEIQTLWNVLDGEAEPLRSLVRFLLLTGQRSGETCRLRWADVDQGAATWSIPGSDRKGGRAHRVPLSPEALALVDGLHPVTGDSEYVFASPSARAEGGPFQWLSHAAGRLREAAGFAFRIHDLRRTCASGLAELGTDRDTIGKVLGHKSADAGVIAIYDRYDREPEKRAALEKWGAHVATLVNPASATETALKSAVAS